MQHGPPHIPSPLRCTASWLRAVHQKSSHNKSLHGIYSAWAETTRALSSFTACSARWNMIIGNEKMKITQASRGPVDRRQSSPPPTPLGPCLWPHPPAPGKAPALRRHFLETSQRTGSASRDEVVSINRIITKKKKKNNFTSEIFMSSKILLRAASHLLQYPI